MRRSHQRASLQVSALCARLKWWTALSLPSGNVKQNHVTFSSFNTRSAEWTGSSCECSLFKTTTSWYFSNQHFAFVCLDFKNVYFLGKRCNRFSSHVESSTFCVSDLFYGSQYVDHCAVQLLSVGHNISQRVEVSGVFNGKVDERQQPVDGVNIRTQIHLGVSLCHQQPVVAKTPNLKQRITEHQRHNTWSHFVKNITRCLSCYLPAFSLVSINKVNKGNKKKVTDLGVVVQNLSPFSGSLVETKGFSTVTGKKQN